MRWKYSKRTISFPTEDRHMFNWTANRRILNHTVAIAIGLGYKEFKTTTIQPQSSGKWEQLNCTTKTRPWYYMAEHQTVWVWYVHLLTYSFDALMHRSTNTTPSSLLLFCQPRVPKLSNFATMIPTTWQTPPQLSFFLQPILWRVISGPLQTGGR